jgi:hypothetical protein
MPVKKNRLRDWGWNNATWILALLFALINVWLTTKLAPLAQDIESLKIKVSAVEGNGQRRDAALIRIENKIDQLILRSCN